VQTKEANSTGDDPSKGTAQAQLAEGITALEKDESEIKENISDRRSTNTHE